MKYKYNQLINYTNWFFALVVVYGLVLVISALAGKLSYVEMRRPFIYVSFLWFMMFCLYNKQYRECYVEFSDDYLVFNSFKIAYKIRSVSVKYEDIIGLYVKQIPLLGINAVVVKAKNLPGDIKVTWRMNKHKELFVKIYESAKGTGETEYIDDRLVKFAEEYNAKQKE